MKNKSKIILKKIVIIISILFVVCIVLNVVFNRLKGKVTVIVNGEVYHVEELECIQSGSSEREEFVNCLNIGKSLFFQNSGLSYGPYTYSFNIKTDAIDITPQFRYFKTDWYSSRILDMTIEITDKGEYWEAYMTLGIDGGSTEESIVNITKGEDVYINWGP